MDEASKEAREVTIEEWVQEHSDDLYRWALHKTSSKELAADLVQETFLAALKGLDDFQGRSKPRSWLFSILKNKIVDHYRKKQNDSLDEHEGDDGASVPKSDGYFDREGDWNHADRMEWSGDEKEYLDDPEFLKVLDHCMEELPERSRSVLMEKFFHRKKGADISKELGVSSTNYWQLIRRAKLMLKDCLAKNWFQG